MAVACPECGAHNPESAEQCTLCGASLHAVEPNSDPVRIPQDVSMDTGSVHCVACEARNPALARFCNQCGKSLITAQSRTREKPLPPPSASEKPSQGNGARLAILLGGAALVVVALFVITSFFKETQPSGRIIGETTSMGNTAGFAPLPEAQEMQVDSLEGVIREARGEALFLAQTELLNLFIGFGRPDRAGELQERIARASGSVEDWTRAGNFYFDWLSMLEETDRPPVAQHVIRAYEEALRLNPDDLDVRMRMGWAFQYDITNPMRAIEENARVLEADSLHLGANFNRGWFLMRIGRTEQAMEQMRKVQRMAGVDSPLGRQAGMILDALQANQAVQTRPPQ